jgi:hypothetical protein
MKNPTAGWGSADKNLLARVCELSGLPMPEFTAL